MVIFHSYFDITRGYCSWKAMDPLPFPGTSAVANDQATLARSTSANWGLGSQEKDQILRIHASNWNFIWLGSNPT